MFFDILLLPHTRLSSDLWMTLGDSYFSWLSKRMFHRRKNNNSEGRNVLACTLTLLLIVRRAERTITAGVLFSHWSLTERFTLTFRHQQTSTKKSVKRTLVSIAPDLNIMPHPYNMTKLKCRPFTSSVSSAELLLLRCEHTHTSPPPPNPLAPCCLKIPMTTSPAGPEIWPIKLSATINLELICESNYASAVMAVFRAMMLSQPLSAHVPQDLTSTKRTPQAPVRKGQHFRSTLRLQPQCVYPPSNLEWFMEGGIWKAQPLSWSSIKCGI